MSRYAGFEFVQGDESYSLASLMDVIVALIEQYEDQHVKISMSRCLLNLVDR